ncbi:MAG: YdeI/OmpD-associated family protein [Imperialibacter sp.]|uniref:YdeI/OmpD-associated family protein n=1 Tax=Imperialibacter sp. TaxID=2038411 RepID=UPI0032EF48FB
MLKDPEETYCPANRKDWREWLQENHQSRQSVWLVCLKASFGTPNISWSEAVEEALCFGWIDSVRKTLDEERFIQFFSKRRPNSTWSKINKKKVQQLTEAKLMTKAGFESIARARQNGSWAILDEAEKLIVPKDLEKALSDTPGAKVFFQNLNASGKKGILQWIVLAKRMDTRKKRIAEVADLAGKGMKPKQFG